MLYTVHCALRSLFLILLVMLVCMTNSKAIGEETETEVLMTNEEDTLLQLPMPDEASSRTVEFGETLTLDELGPIIINKDGSLRRITNWSELSPEERKHTKRRVSLRNHKRLGVLKNNERLEIIQRYYEEQASSSQQDNANIEGGGEAGDTS
jgi:hypothetical protein